MLTLILAEGGKILVVPQDGSHWLSMRPVVEKMQWKRHEVVVIVPSTSLYMKSKEPQNCTVKVWKDPGGTSGWKSLRFLKMYDAMKKFGYLSAVWCEHLLQNKELMRYLEESKFDALLTDPVVPCGVILAEHLSLPSVYFLRGIPCGLDFEATQCPNPASYVPRAFSQLTDRMTFLQRVKNLLFDTQNLFLCDFAFDPFSKLASEFLQREVTVLDLLRKASVWLLRLEFVLDYPRPLMPNIIPIGGVNCAHKELPLRGIPCGLDFEATQCPNPASYVPRAFSQLTDRMTFLQRVKNLLFDTQNLFLCDFAFDPFSKLASEFLQREVTVLDLLRKASVWLLRLEFVLDYPRPLMPNIIPIGGVNCAHKELPQVGFHPCCLTTSFFTGEFFCFFTWVFPKLEECGRLWATRWKISLEN
uniref:glucuronosyltransferase n=1 Tax=Ficedula albicollis TaxID=59894 RepID=A0A803VKH7_FICAL